jgi:hypothetical protein
MNGYPAGWAQFTPAEKREYRLNQFLNPTNVKFVSPEAETAYKMRAQRYIDAYNVKEPDRVPINLPVGDLPNIMHGVSMHTAMYDVEKAIESCREFNKQYSDELEYFAMPLYAPPGRAMEILDYRLYAFPGHGLSVNAPSIQFIEGEYMKLEEYEAFFRDPSDFWLRTYLPKIFGAFEGFRYLPPLTDILEIPTGQLMALAQPQVLETLQKMIDAGKDLQKRNAIMAQSMDSGAAHGFPSMMGVLNFAPFDAIGDTLRGTKAVMMDMFRNGDKLLKAIDIMTDIIIYSILHNPMIYNAVTVGFPLHKGADGWMSPKQYEKFYWPSLKKVMNALINEGLICQMFAEGSYNTRLEIIKDDFPKGSVVWWFDQTDMALAKKELGDKFAIQGNVPSSLMVTGSPAEAKACCRKLIETCGKGGGYIMAAGCIAENPKLENLRAMMEAIREYGVYR